MSERQISLRQLIAALQDAQSHGSQWVTVGHVVEICVHLEASPVNQPFAASGAPTPEGCQHVHTVETPTLGQPGGKLCLDCDQNL